ncbi:MAG: hypothetical protein NC110_08045, partial [Ruminococcus sp.]|nr:hypothetical protein [Ruminococcus sp.]
ERNIDGEREKYGIRFYESDNDSEKEFINYSFFGIEFVFDDEENLAWISFQNPDLSQKLEEYPIITAEKAKELLKSGDYISDVPHEFPGVEHLAKTELIYHTDMKTEFFMPYYRFYVELPNLHRDDGIKTYGIYYVPAVDGKYIQK